MTKAAMIGLSLAALAELPALADDVHRWGDAQGTRADGDVSASSLRFAQREPRGMRFEVFIHLKQGMSEAELLQRAGPPDYESVEGTDTSAQAVIQDSVVVDPETGNAVPQKNVLRSERTEVVKSWYYLPTTSDPFTTRVMLIGGRVANIERTKKF